MDDEKLELMKQLLGIDLILDNSKDSILNHYLEKASDIIMGYCNIVEIPKRYDRVVVDYALYLYNHKNNMGLTKKSEGERTIVYEEGIPFYIKSALPLPRIQVGGYRV